VGFPTRILTIIIPPQYSSTSHPWKSLLSVGWPSEGGPRRGHPTKKLSGAREWLVSFTSHHRKGYSAFIRAFQGLVRRKSPTLQILSDRTNRQSDSQSECSWTLAPPSGSRGQRPTSNWSGVFSTINTWISCACALSSVRHWPFSKPRFFDIKPVISSRS